MFSIFEISDFFDFVLILELFILNIMPRYCVRCNGTWYQRIFQRRSNEFCELRSKSKSKYGHLNRTQENVLFRQYLHLGKYVILCRKHLKQFAKIGDGTIHRLLKESRKTALDERPVYDAKKT